MDGASSPYQYESRPPKTDQCFVNGASKKISVDLRPISRSMSRSCLEVKVPIHAIEEMVTSPTRHEIFQFLTKDRPKKIWSNSRAGTLKGWQGYKLELTNCKKFQSKGPQVASDRVRKKKWCDLFVKCKGAQLKFTR